ncbi:MAG: D-alanyl-D-alanine carboxypeptidase family protein [Clostridia bacterium]|nr:D-alanyl-D-alanine carboxypeptidase family protein [Clostridia bacterium]
MNNGRQNKSRADAARTTGARRAAPAKKKKKSGGGYLFAAVFFCLAAVAVAVLLVMNVTKGGKEESQAESSAVSEHSSAVSEYSSAAGESEPSLPESSEPEPGSSAEETRPEESASGIKQPAKTAEYENRIGVKYLIDMTEYEEYVCPEDEEKYVFLVGPKHPLAADFVPDDLIKCTHMRENRPEGYSYIVRTVDIALDAFIKEAEANGHYGIGVTNGYRSYATQEWLFNSYVDKEWSSGKFATKEDAIAEALTYSTRPGTSEHQSGLCCDMNNVDLSDVSKFNNSPTAKWMEDNAYRFGFILRYPEGKQDITGIIYESWHFRYVGRTVATEIHDLGITLDEYLAGK